MKLNNVAISLDLEDFPETRRPLIDFGDSVFTGSPLKFFFKSIQALFDFFRRENRLLLFILVFFVLVRFVYHHRRGKLFCSHRP